MKKEKRKHYGLIFPGLVIFAYVVLFFLYPEKIWKSITISGKLLINIIPVIFLVILFMAVINYIISPRTVLKFTGSGSGIKGWFFAIFTGIISHGPIYAWYPLLRDLQAKGMRNGFIAVFLYNRAIKIPLLPLMIYYFGIEFVIVLFIYMVIASVVEGKIVEIVG